MLDIQTIFLNLFLSIPWWIYPLVILAIYLKVKMKDFELEQLIRKKEKIYDKINNEKNKTNNTNTQIQPKPSNKEKGDKYEAFICEQFREQGYTIASHGKDNGVRDQGIDIIAKKKNQILFIQCKDWSTKNKYRINQKEIQYIRMNVRDYLDKNELFKNYDWKILYVTSENILDRSGFHKIKEFSGEIEHMIIPMIK